MSRMACSIFIVFFAPSLAVLAWGEAMCGVSWGVFQTLSTSYACEVVPTVLRSYVTAYVCMCWGAGILLSSGVVRAVVNVQGELGWKLPFALQWIWPLPLAVGAYLAPESPWNAVRRGNIDQARKSLSRLRQDSPTKEREVESTLAYIRYTTELEKAETVEASYIDCFRGTNLRRTEIVSNSSSASALLTFVRTVSSGQLKSYRAMLSSGTALFSCNKPASRRFRPLMSTFLYRPATVCYAPSRHRG